MCQPIRHSVSPGCSRKAVVTVDEAVGVVHAMEAPHPAELVHGDVGEIGEQVEPHDAKQQLARG